MDVGPYALILLSLSGLWDSGTSRKIPTGQAECDKYSGKGGVRRGQGKWPQDSFEKILVHHLVVPKTEAVQQTLYGADGALLVTASPDREIMLKKSKYQRGVNTYLSRIKGQGSMS